MIEIKYFQSCHYPDVFMREQIAMKLELKESRISVSIIVIPIIIFIVVIIHYYRYDFLSSKKRKESRILVGTNFTSIQTSTIFFCVRTKRDFLFVGLVPKPPRQVQEEREHEEGSWQASA